MNENEILDNPNVEVELENLIDNGNIESTDEETSTDILENDILPTEETEDTFDENNSELDISENIDENSISSEEQEIESEEEIEDENLDTLVEEVSIEDSDSCTQEQEIEVVEKPDDERCASQVNEDECVDNENFITNDLENINIEFGIEAKGFILSLKMMEAMIEKGYIFKDILNDKIFDAVMIFNGNLENTVVTSDIKIKIDNGKIQLIKG